MTAKRMAGALAVLAGVGLLVSLTTYHPLPHLPFGPGMALSAIGLGLLTVGAILIGRPDGALRRSKTKTHPGATRRRAGFVLTLALPVALALALPHVGLTLGLFLVLAPLLAWHTRRPGLALVLAASFAGAVMGLARGVLGVPLPEGPLSRLSEGIRLPWI